MPLGVIEVDYRGPRAMLRGVQKKRAIIIQLLVRIAARPCEWPATPLRGDYERTAWTGPAFGGPPITYNTDLSSLPISDGSRVVRIPQASMTSSLASAVSSPPEISAPACPIRFPGGAVTPAINPTTGLVILSLAQRAAFTSSGPPISPIITTASVSGSSLNILSTSTCFRPLMGSPPIPTAEDWPRPSSVS